MSLRKLMSTRHKKIFKDLLETPPSNPWYEILIPTPPWNKEVNMVWFITFIDDAKAQHIKERARKDEDFCLIIASLLASLGTVAFGSTRLFLPLTAELYTARHKHLMPRECTELRPNSAKSQFVVPGNNIIWPNSPKWDNGQNFSNLLVTFGQLTAGGFS
ncbi:hypothetical protein R3P38DRAFT_2758852 [Favolaschia claudopus]|uniref:Uncharacterized protein n=1 Tax=Favolaschia claudopus TaxID=2862362 RepID=A0AAW0E5Y0_9AGAR